MQVEKYLEEIRQSSLVVMDGNIPVETMDYVLNTCKVSRIPGRERLYLYLSDKGLKCMQQYTHIEG
jgi:hypothetical protein